jgi:D-serine deaminase-like pyridoxal phosphate-dependent protein
MMLVDDLPTPCLLVERSRLRSNLQRMQKKADTNETMLRPHVKTHKSVALARMQIDGGARGITAAKVGEAETFVEAGIDDVRLAYTVVGEDKYQRLLDLMDRARISFCVETVEGALLASAFFESKGRVADVLLEVNSGLNRCGVDPTDSRSIDIAREVESLPGLRLIGILTHAGQAYNGPHDGETPQESLIRVSHHERNVMLAFAVRLREERISTVEPGQFEISVGSTPTMRYFENRELDGFKITEIRPGNYVFNDAMQVGLEVADLNECALTVLTTVISRHRDRNGHERLFVDAGKKVMTSDVGYRTDGFGTLLYNARVMERLPHAHVIGLSEEHGWIEVSGGSTFGVGDRIRLVPNHACTAVNTQDRFHLVDGEDVVDTLLVDARGRVI